MGARTENTLVIGGSRQDTFILQEAGRSLGFQPETVDVRDAAEVTCSTTLSDLLLEVRKLKCNGNGFIDRMT